VQPSHRLRKVCLQMRYDTAELKRFAQQLLQAAGLATDKAECVAEVLLEGDLLGHNTHGLALLSPYLGEIVSGGMQTTGQAVVVSDHPAALVWDGCRLPGPWLVRQAMDVAMDRAKTTGTCTVVIQRSHHIACLAAYHHWATQQGMVMLLHSSDPNTASVAPFGGLDPVFTPNPVSAAWPASAGPVMVDISTSATTNGMTNRIHKEGGLLPAPWVMDSKGRSSRDPAVLFDQPAGTILPLGGMDSGHKGYGLSLMVEALTGGLSGFGRADPAQGWGATVFLQILNPQCFGGLDAFVRQMDHVNAQCHAARPAHTDQTVRLPGERGLQHKAKALAQGLDLHPTIMPALAAWVDRWDITLPPQIQ
jgi:L-lactate dehydrogenase